MRLNDLPKPHVPNYLSAFIQLDKAAFLYLFFPNFAASMDEHKDSFGLTTRIYVRISFPEPCTTRLTILV